MIKFAKIGQKINSDELMHNSKLVKLASKIDQNNPELADKIDMLVVKAYNQQVPRWNTPQFYEYMDRLYTQYPQYYHNMSWHLKSLHQWKRMTEGTTPLIFTDQKDYDYWLRYLPKQKGMGAMRALNTQRYSNFPEQYPHLKPERDQSVTTGVRG